jgi:phosphoribosylaminoimidazolecarboxamide formyltransferase/IMP cyclohydrolase
VLDATQIQGKDLSYNNLLDADAALAVVRGLSDPACVIIKHTIPCGFAIRDTTADAFGAALASDPVSAFGGIVALTRAVDDETAERMATVFFEVILAPAFSESARHRLASRKNLRLLALPEFAWQRLADTEVRSISGGLLIQETDTSADASADWTLATSAQVDASQMADLRIAWHVARHVKSNAIVLVRDRAVVGVGPGQPNRVDSVRIAIERAGDRAQGAAMASDAFFPFADGVEVAIAAGVASIIQPGGSIRDTEVVAACDNSGVAMMFTGVRHFRH